MYAPELCPGLKIQSRSAARPDDNDDIDFDGNHNDDQWSGPSVLYFNLLAANSPECTFDTSSYKINDDDDDVWGQIVPQGGNFDAFSLPLLAV